MGHVISGWDILISGLDMLYLDGTCYKSTKYKFETTKYDLKIVKML